MKKKDLINIETDNPEFQDALKLIQDTNSSVFLTGRAGTGKSTFLRYICQITHKKFIVLAPTGIAAINAGGVTIHSFFKIPFRPILPNDPDLCEKDNRIFEFLKYSNPKIKLIREVELVIIDEVSMVRADILDFIDQVLRVYTKNRNTPFGGKQLLLVGDAFQLEPVVKNDEWQILRKYYKTPYFFSANAFCLNPPIQIELKKVYRQKEPDFIDILDKVRLNQTNPEHISKLNNRLNPNFKAPNDELFITLATRRDTADYINDQKLAALQGKEYILEGIVSGDFPVSSLPTLTSLVLKENAQVMFVKNDSGENRRWFNGSLGRVEEIADDGITIRLENDELYFVEKEKWENLRYSFDEENHRIITEEIGSFVQYPLKLAWAITVHKSQGLTFDKVMIDFSGGAFAGGQLYVALSRCRTLSGMMLKTPVSPRDIIVNQEVILFAREANNKVLIESELRKAKADAEYAAALRFFRENNWKEAIAAFARAIDYRNDLMNPQFQRFLASEMRFVNHYRHQIINLEAQLEESRKNIEEFAREYYLMANECESKYKDSRSAIANLNKAIKLNPSFTDALMRRAILLRNTGDLHSAEKDCSKILKIKQQHFRALLLRGSIRLELNKLDSAYQDLLEAKNLRKKNPEVYYLLSKVCRKMGETNKAKQFSDIAKGLEEKKY